MVTAGRWIPDRGDFVWMKFSPQSGRELAEVRPALTLSPALFNRLTGMALLCPIRSRATGHNFEVALPSESPVQGVVLADQVRGVNWRSRRVRWAGKAGEEAVLEALAKIQAILA